MSMPNNHPNLWELTQDIKRLEAKIDWVASCLMQVQINTSASHAQTLQRYQPQPPQIQTQTEDINAGENQGQAVPVSPQTKTGLPPEIAPQPHNPNTTGPGDSPDTQVPGAAASSAPQTASNPHPHCEPVATGNRQGGPQSPAVTASNPVLPATQPVEKPYKGPTQPGLIQTQIPPAPPGSSLNHNSAAVSPVQQAGTDSPLWEKVQSDAIGSNSTKMESFVGRYVLAGLAAILVLFAAGSLLMLLWDQIPEVTKLSVVSVLAVLFAGSGAVVALKKPEWKPIFASLVGTGAGLGYLSILSGASYFQFYDGSTALSLTALWTFAMVAATFATREAFTHVVISLGVTTAIYLGSKWLVTLHSGSPTNIEDQGGPVTLLAVLVVLFEVALVIGAMYALDEKQRWVSFTCGWAVPVLAVFFFIPTISHQYALQLVLLAVAASLALIMIRWAAPDLGAVLGLVLLGLAAVGHLCLILIGGAEVSNVWTLLVAALFWVLVGIFVVVESGFTTVQQSVVRQRAGLIQVLLIAGTLALSSVAFGISMRLVGFFHGTYATGNVQLAAELGALMMAVAASVISAAYALRHRHSGTWLYACGLLFALLVLPPGVGTYPLVRLIGQVVALAAMFVMLYVGKVKIYQHNRDYFDLNRWAVAILGTVASSLLFKTMFQYGNSASEGVLLAVLGAGLLLAVLTGLGLLWPRGDFFSRRKESVKDATAFGVALNWAARIWVFILLIFAVQAPGTPMGPGLLVIFTVIILALSLAGAYLWVEADASQGWSVVIGLIGLYTTMLLYATLLSWGFMSPLASVLLVGVGAGCVALGFVIRTKPMRLFGLIVVVAGVLKLTIADVAQQNNLARIGALVLGGLICFAISFAYTAWERHLRIQRLQENNPVPDSGSSGRVKAASGTQTVPGSNTHLDAGAGQTPGYPDIPAPTVGTPTETMGPEQSGDPEVSRPLVTDRFAHPPSDTPQGFSMNPMPETGPGAEPGAVPPPPPDSASGPTLRVPRLRKAAEQGKFKP